MNLELPLFMQDERVNKIFQEVISCIPKENKVYLIGGTVRNSLFYEFHKEKLPQRDYDILLIGDRKKFVENLRKKGFDFGKINRKKEITLKKPKFKGAKIVSDFVVLDIHSSNTIDIKTNIRENSNFTINCNALLLKDVIFENWKNKVISLPSAIEDIKNKKIRINKITHPAQLFACIRFISKGFNKPTDQEINNMTKALKEIPKDIFEFNIDKLIDYVGNKESTLEIIKDLGLNKDILEFNK